MFKKLILLIGILLPSITLGGGNGSVNSGFNTGNSNHDSAWVNNQTEITGSNVNINVDGKTTLTGAVIAAVDTNGNDNGNLNLTTGELAYSDITDFNNNNATGFGLGTGVGGNTDAGISNLHPSGSTTISMQNTGSESEQINRATIGGGNLTITNNTDTSGLNRDTTIAQEITKDITTGALDTSVTIDNRLFSGTGREQIINQHENLEINTVKAAAGAYGTVAGTASIIGDVITGDKSIDDASKAWGANQSGMATGIKRAGTDFVNETLKKVDDGTASPKEIADLLKMTSDGTYNVLYSNDKENVILTDKDGNTVGVISRQGFNDLQNNKGYVNAANGAATDSYTLLYTDAHERAHNYTDTNETLADNAASNEMGYYNTISDLTGGYSVSNDNSLDLNTQTNWNNTYSNNELLLSGTKSANAVTGETVDNLIGTIAKGTGSFYYMNKYGVNYNEGMQLVLDNNASIAKIDSIESKISNGVVNIIDKPFEDISGNLGYPLNGPLKTFGSNLQNGLTYVLGEDKAAITLNILEVAGTVSIIKGGLNYNPSNTNTFWKSQNTKTEILATSANDALESANNIAHNVNSQNALNKKLSGLEKAQKNAVKTIELQDGRIRYYSKESPSDTPGPTRGRSFVTEYNKQTGSTRQWTEMYDHSGKVNRVHPKSINGQTIESNHYPLTGSELK